MLQVVETAQGAPASEGTVDLSVKALFAVALFLLAVLPPKLAPLRPPEGLLTGSLIGSNDRSWP